MASATQKHVKAAVAMVVAVLLLVASPTHAGNVLLQGYKLSPGGELDQSPYSLSMQHDCNLVLYHSGNAIWATNTQGRATECYFIMQNDGNAVVYSGSGTPLWATGTNGRNDGQHYIILQSDGNLVMYNGGGTAIWASGTNGKGLPTGFDGRQLLRSSSPAGISASPSDDANSAQAAALHH